MKVYIVSNEKEEDVQVNINELLRKAVVKIEGTFTPPPEKPKVSQNE